MSAAVKIFALALTSVLICGGCKPKPQSQPQPTKDAAFDKPARFVFPASEKFQVHLLREKRGKHVEVMYDCRLAKTNGEFLLEWVDAKVISFDNKVISKAARSKLASVEAMFRLPTFRISADGRFLEAINAEEAINRASQLLPNQSEGRPSLVDSEAGVKILKSVYAQIWKTWVEAWIGLEVASNETLVINDDKSSNESKLTNLGPVSTNRQLAHLKYEEYVTKQDFGADIDRLTESLTQGTGAKKPAPMPSNVRMNKSTIIEVHTDPETLRPYWVKQTMTATVNAPGEGEHSRTEVDEYRFLWPQATRSK
jgi:hypothetical protein